MSTFRVDGDPTGTADTAQELGDAPVKSAVQAPVRATACCCGPAVRKPDATPAVDERSETVPLPLTAGVTPARKL